MREMHETLRTAFSDAFSLMKWFFFQYFDSKFHSRLCLNSNLQLCSIGSRRVMT